MTLSELEEGLQARIIDLSGINPLVRRRLLDLGILEGSMIRLIHRLPLRGAFALEVNHQEFGLRYAEAKRIEVEVV
ncbi:FeoA family protein [Baia soyae]|uniref:Ferrous iron transport protein A n=1 Tax=Baia soyae TaxID=1544746 RepID=A0A4R2SGJ4_9BACL|nr:FeoA family protein [Baia soyae]TCP70640.1 ferrous iron transport protein A [Baia soyae]